MSGEGIRVMKPLHEDKGFTLVELIVVMAIFITVMVTASMSFETINKHFRQQSRISETLAEEIVGLEVLRSDLKQTGFGLPWTFQRAPATTLYKECQVSSDSVPASGFWVGSPPGGATSWVRSFNDATGNPPRAIQSADTLFNTKDGVGSKYLVIKSMVVGGGPQNTAARKWTNVAYANGVHSIKTWDDADRDLESTDRVVVVKNSMNTTPATQQLMVTSTGSFSTTFNNYSTLIQPHQDGDTYEVFGVASSDPAMPFNRADYYVRTPDAIPTDCAPHTGTLFKATLKHADGTFAEMPLLDCVADMQIVYGRDTSASGSINDHTTAAPSTPDLLRAELKEIRVYILAHQGRKDPGYTYPSRYVTVGESFGGSVKGRVFDLQDLISGGGDSWKRYRWKVHTIVVRPKNLSQ